MLPEDRDGHAEPENEPYVKADRRASREAAAEPRQEPADEAAAGHETPAEKPDEAKAVESTASEAPDITVYSLLRMSVGMYIEQAWIHLGVRMDPHKQKVEQNLPLAKVAIDVVAFLIEQLQPHLDANEKKELELALANLRMNYVQRA